MKKSISFSFSRSIIWQMIIIICTLSIPYSEYGIQSTPGEVTSSEFYVLVFIWGACFVGGLSSSLFWKLDLTLAFLAGFLSTTLFAFYANYFFAQYDFSQIWFFGFWICVAGIWAISKMKKETASGISWTKIIIPPLISTALILAGFYEIFG